MIKSENDFSRLEEFNDLVSGLVCLSTAFGSVSKSQWTDLMESLSDDEELLWKELSSSVRYVVDNRGGKKAVMQPLGDMLCGDKEKLLENIKLFLAENKEKVHTAHLLIALEKARSIKACPFTIFLKALNKHFDTEITPRTPQKRYSDIKKEGSLNDNTEAMKNARQVIEKWTEVFRQYA